MLTRTAITETLQDALAPLPAALAMWEGGSAAFGEVDQWSDVDLQVIVEEGHEAEIIATAEAALRTLSPLATRYEVPAPTWHGHWQCFYQFEEASPYLTLDFVVMSRSNPNRFLEPEIHGQRRALFDKEGLLDDLPRFDWEALHARIAQRRQQIRASWPFFRLLARKEIARGRAIEAIAFYQGFTLRTLVELLRMAHSPARYTFGSRRLYSDLPPEIVARLEWLYLVPSLEALAGRLDDAEAWVEQLLREIRS